VPRPKKLGDRKPRSIRLPTVIWERLDKEAERCRRDSTSQLEALLIKVFKLGDVEIHIPKAAKELIDEEEESPTGEEKN